MGISKRANIIILVLFLSIIAITAAFFTWKWFQYKEELAKFKSIEINSSILELRDLKRGSYSIELNTAEGLVEFDLPIAYEIRMDGILEGDSLSKKSNSGKCEVFRMNKLGRPYKVSVFNIY